ncbi:class I SAM-dependent methyltransferase [Endozoicomonas lisbonensis]|uniref:Methyltransferase small domain-containing protein n=1 Tax=Endozoicomonas lisbonensis TaxID=3120522 RepID=A0ABV2SNA7_9GAMM
MTDWIIWLLTGLAFAITSSIVFWSLRLGITPTPTSRKVRRAMEPLLPESVNGRIYELGCGWGSLLLMLSRRYPNHSITGYEQSTIPYLVARILTVHKANVRVLKQNFFTTELKDAGLVTCYLFPGAMKQMDGYLKRQLSGHCTVISHTFRLPGWESIREIQANDLYRTSVFVYRKGIYQNKVVNSADTEEYCRSRSPASDTSPAVQVNS